MPVLDLHFLPLCDVVMYNNYVERLSDQTWCWPLNVVQFKTWLSAIICNLHQPSCPVHPCCADSHGRLCVFMSSFKRGTKVGGLMISRYSIHPPPHPSGCVFDQHTHPDQMFLGCRCRRSRTFFCALLPACVLCLQLPNIPTDPKSGRPPGGRQCCPVTSVNAH